MSQRIDVRGCVHCEILFIPDCRNRNRQRYCSAPACRTASRSASNKLWRAKNPDYDSGRFACARTTAYRLTKKCREAPASQGASNTRPDDPPKKTRKKKAKSPAEGTARTPQDVLNARPDASAEKARKEAKPLQEGTAPAPQDALNTRPDNPTKPPCKEADPSPTWTAPARQDDPIAQPTASTNEIGRSLPPTGGGRHPVSSALQDLLMGQPIGEANIFKDPVSATALLQDLCQHQHIVLIGLISHLIDSSLQDDIAAFVRGLIRKALDMLMAPGATPPGLNNGVGGDRPRDFQQNPGLP